MLKPIPLQELQQAPRQTLRLDFRQSFPGFASLTPVEGSVRLVHRGQFLEVFGKAQTIVTLTCHRCLQQFNHRLNVDFQEILWIEDPTPTPPAQELELTTADLVEKIPPKGEFDPQDWVYQHLCLELPQQQACSNTCQPIELQSQQPAPMVDSRWSLLQQLRQQLGESSR